MTDEERREEEKNSNQELSEEYLSMLRELKADRDKKKQEQERLSKRQSNLDVYLKNSENADLYKEVYEKHGKEVVDKYPSVLDDPSQVKNLFKDCIDKFKKEQETPPPAESNSGSPTPPGGNSNADKDTEDIDGIDWKDTDEVKKVSPESFRKNFRKAKLSKGSRLFMETMNGG